MARAASDRGNKLKGSEYDDTTWSARSWTSYTMQRLSCTLARAVAMEIATAMRLTRVRDSRDDAVAKGGLDRVKIMRAASKPPA